MSPIVLVGTTICVFLALCIAGSMMLTETSRATQERILQVTRSGQQLSSSKARKESLRETIVNAAHWLRMHVAISEKGGVVERMAQAGFRGSVAVDCYMAARVVGPLSFMLVGALIPFARVFWMLAMPAIVYLVPDLVLGQIIRRRRNALRKSMPDTLDLLVICVDAGLGLDQAMLRVAEELVIPYPAMNDELMLINREQRAGKPRLEAWEAMAARTKVPEIDSFVNMLMQTDRFGTPISRALTAFATNVRMQRTQRAEEAAAKTTVKIIFPLVIFIFPCIFIVLLGPAAIGIFRGFNNGF